MNKYKYGIDFGTSNSSISIMVPTVNGLEVKTLELEPGDLFREVVASRIALEKNLKPIEIGRFASMAFASGEAAYYIDHIKWKLTDKNIINLKVDGIDLATNLLKHIKEKINRVAHPEAKGVVFGIPIGFTDFEKEILINAAIKAGFVKDSQEGRNSIEFVSEPIAVALDYGMQLHKNENILVFDYGGGTLDIVIMNMSKISSGKEVKPHEVLAKAGRKIGGDFLTWRFFLEGFLPKYGRYELKRELGFDNKVSDDEARKFGFMKLSKLLGLNNDLSNNGELRDEMIQIHEGLILLDELEKCKCRLSFNDTAILSVMIGKLSIPRLDFTVEDFSKSIINEVHEAELDVNNALSSSGLEKQDIDIVLLAGGSSYIPAFQNMLKELFGEKRVKSSGNQMTSITRGLAIAGYESNKGKVQQVEDIVDCNYGVWNTTKGEVSVIIPKGEKITNTQINKSTRAGICKKYRLLDSSSNLIELDIYQEKEKISTIKVPIGQNESKDEFAVYFSIDRSKGWLQVSVLNIIKNRWIDIPFNRDKVTIKQ
ncbi:Hsp70 family protein [Bacillus pinisoli]|uniref:Hsp70 family protein n=1 Tax=Bacillus pinisoli TaxID=2901866 RepID=UPI001FF1C919|nr:Hsp70 family protein [Bacillus pinisoli]